MTVKYEIPGDKAAGDVVRLGFERHDDGVCLVTLDKKGNTDWYLLDFKNDGTVHTVSGLDFSGLPFGLIRDGELNVEPDEDY